jgi:hypothetical protein
VDDTDRATYDDDNDEDTIAETFDVELDDRIV